MKVHVLFLIMTFLLLACTKKEVKKDDRPDWIDQPDPDFVGICTSDVTDLIAQERCEYNNGLAASTVNNGREKHQD